MYDIWSLGPIQTIPYMILGNAHRYLESRVFDIETVTSVVEARCAKLTCTRRAGIGFTITLPTDALCDVKALVDAAIGSVSL